MAAASVLTTNPGSSKDNSFENVANDSKGTQSSENSETKDGYESGKKWGYDLYPERRGDKVKSTWAQIALLGGGRAPIDKIRCERNVYACINESHLVRLMISALKSSGCEIDIRRHISCEVCDSTVTGGYDPELNQVVICQNTAKKKGFVQGVLTHEMIHMFDYCRAELDFKNVKHLACTEIRAANLAHCSFMGALVQGYVSPFRVAKMHAECVKGKAVASVMAVRKISEEEARQAVDSVFEKCYNDLEPIGRRLRRGTRDMERAYHERYHFGYRD